MSQLSLVRVAALASVASLTLACSDATSPRGGGKVSLAFRSTATAAAANAALASIVPITSGGHTLDLQQVQLGLSRVELERAARSSSSEDHEELKLGPLTVDLPLGGGETATAAVDVPPGRYAAFEAKVSSVRVRGTFDGKAFDVTVPVDAEIETEFRAPVEVTSAAPLNVAVRVDAASWFRARDGSLVDPSALPTNDSLRSSVRSRIVASFESFEDDDHDGHEDHR